MEKEGSFACFGVKIMIKTKMCISALDRGLEWKERKWRVWRMEVKLGLGQRPTG